MNYDVIIIGAGPGGIFSAYELTHRAPALRVAVFESGHPLSRRRCPIDGEKIKTCIGCPTCSIMSGFGGAGAFSDGKYNITNDFGGTLYEYIGKKQALELMRYVDEINLAHGGEGTKLYSTAGTRFKTVCIQNDLHLLDASVRHLGTDINYKVLQNIYEELKDKVTFFFDTPVTAVAAADDGYRVFTAAGEYTCQKCVISVGRSGSKWMEAVCRELNIPTHSNRVDLGVRVELPAAVFAHLTDELYESKIVYRTEKYGDKLVGIDVEVAGAIAEKLGMKLEVVDIAFDSIVSGVQAGKYDMGMAGMTVNEERLEQVNFSDSYSTGIQVVIVKEGGKVQSLDDMGAEGVIIGTQSGTTGFTYASSDFGDEKVKGFTKTTDAVAALINGQVDCVMLDNEPAKALVAANPDAGLSILDTAYTVEDYAIAINKDNNDLLTKVNAALAELKADGTLQGIIDKYIK